MTIRVIDERSRDAARAASAICSSIPASRWPNGVASAIAATLRSRVRRDRCHCRRRSCDQLSRLELQHVATSTLLLCLSTFQRQQCAQQAPQAQRSWYVGLQQVWICLLYTSDAADEEDSVD